MKNVMKFSGFGVLFLVLVLLYLRYDKTGYYYGVECSFCNKRTPKKAKNSKIEHLV